MPSIDLPLDQLRAYQPETTAPRDAEDFWGRTLAAARSAPAELELGPVQPKLAGVTAHQIRFRSVGDAPIAGWLVRPDAGGPFPGVVHYHGYGARGARPLELYTLAAQGLAVMSMDCRGQDGDSPDVPPADGGHHAGWLTRGLRDPQEHYYRYVYADAVRAVDCLASLDDVDDQRLAVTGTSQGGGLALAAAALSGRAGFVWADVPFLCDFPRAVETAEAPPYPEIADFLRRHPDLVETAYRTLSYVDVANLAPMVTCPAVVTVGLWDVTCPPSTIFGTFNRLSSADKELMVFPYHGHELSYEIEERRLRELVRRLRPAGPPP
ncbi:MAG: acetylxylan esterase [Acidimicrobiales bacterium]